MSLVCSYTKIRLSGDKSYSPAKNSVGAFHITALPKIQRKGMGPGAIALRRSAEIARFLDFADRRHPGVDTGGSHAESTKSQAPIHKQIQTT